MNIKYLLVSFILLSTMFAQCDEAGGNSTWISDGYCDAGNNNETCEWDGGDCCSSTCVPSTYDCDESGQFYGPCATNDCLDPNGNNDDCADTTGGTTGGGDNSCAGYCGTSAPTCWCDDLCEGFGDCCPDYWEECLGETTGGETTGS